MRLQQGRLPVWLALSPAMQLEVIWDFWDLSMIWGQDTWHWLTLATHPGKKKTWKLTHFTRMQGLLLTLTKVDATKSETNFNSDKEGLSLNCFQFIALGRMLPKPRPDLCPSATTASPGSVSSLWRRWTVWECWLIWRTCPRQPWMMHSM